MASARRSFTDEFKAEAVALLESSGRPLQHVAHELGIQPSMLQAWRKRLGQPGEPPPRYLRAAAAPLAVKDQAAEVARLKRENDRLLMEKEIRKRTLSIVSGPPK